MGRRSSARSQIGPLEHAIGNCLAGRKFSTIPMSVVQEVVGRDWTHRISNLAKVAQVDYPQSLFGEVRERIDWNHTT